MTEATINYQVNQLIENTIQLVEEVFVKNHEFIGTFHEARTGNYIESATIEGVALRYTKYKDAWRVVSAGITVKCCDTFDEAIVHVAKHILKNRTLLTSVKREPYVIVTPQLRQEVSEFSKFKQAYFTDAGLLVDGAVRNDVKIYTNLDTVVVVDMNTGLAKSLKGFQVLSQAAFHKQLFSVYELLKTEASLYDKFIGMSKELDYTTEETEAGLKKLLAKFNNTVVEA
jgi:hypothetical protein